MNELNASNDSLDYERIGRFIYSFHRACGSVEALSEVSPANGAPHQLASRAYNLAKMFDRVVKNSSVIRESEIDSVLREATNVQVEIDEWRSEASRP
jgi:hypothetical protein